MTLELQEKVCKTHGYYSIGSKLNKPVSLLDLPLRDSNPGGCNTANGANSCTTHAFAKAPNGAGN
ncbi:hypothetical protein EJB05_50811 [Eragrostis curvula]|uniref:Uncharacterized protein n=1 Tax=Eragrostis curvula TaxID=38414 RepID=A0A5J9SXF5_9POAL|nr:hypothetical protein EJB05_50811 [Eragrostis curvula]